jgi:hypothetical protein
MSENAETNQEYVVIVPRSNIDEQFKAEGVLQSEPRLVDIFIPFVMEDVPEDGKEPNQTMVVYGATDVRGDEDKEAKYASIAIVIDVKSGDFSLRVDDEVAKIVQEDKEYSDKFKASIDIHMTNIEKILNDVFSDKAKPVEENTETEEDVENKEDTENTETEGKENGTDSNKQ